MEERSLRGYWNEKKLKLRQKFTILKDDDLNFKDGKEAEMLERLQYKLGKTKEELRDIIIHL